MNKRANYNLTQPLIYRIERVVSTLFVKFFNS